MRPSLALAIGAVFSVVSGLALVLAPGQLLSPLGFAATAEIQARDAGVLLIGVGIIDWFARDAVGAPLRGLLLGNLFIRVAGMAVNYWELAAGLMPRAAAGIFPVLTVINIVLIVVFALALRRA